MKKPTLPLNYENYIFDLYGTLIDIHTDEGDISLWEKLSLFFAYQNAHYQPKELQNEYERLTKELATEGVHYSHESFPEIDITKVFSKLYAQKNIQADEALILYTCQFFRVLSTEYVRPYKDTTKMLSYLKKQGKKIYLLSNAQRVFTMHELCGTDILKFFDGILISSDHGVKKPDIRFFKLLLEKYGVDFSKSLFIGNDSTTDIKGAMAVNMDTFYVNSNISPKGDKAPFATYTFDDFTEW